MAIRGWRVNVEKEISLTGYPVPAGEYRLDDAGVRPLKGYHIVVNDRTLFIPVGQLAKLRDNGSVTFPEGNPPPIRGPRNSL